MFSASPARLGARRRGRLVAACTAGVLAAGALAVSTAGTASADSGPAARPTAHLTAPAAQQPTLTLPPHHKTPYAATAGTALKTPRYDYDGDGHSDLLVQDANHTIGVLSSLKVNNNQKGYTALGKPDTLYRALITPGNLTNNSSGDEVLGLTGSGRLSMFTTTGVVSGSPLWTGGGWQMYNQVLAVGDINGDGWGDLLARTPSGDLYLYKGTGNQYAPFAGRVKVGHGYGIYDQLIGAGDLTGTGHETLVARDLAGNLWMYQLNGTGAAMSARVQIGHGWNVYNQLIGWGDDPAETGQILGRTLGGTLYWYGGNGKGTLTPRVMLGANWNAPSIADQGHQEVWGKDTLIAQTPTGNLYAYGSNYAGGLWARVQIGTTSNWKGARLLSPVSLTDAGWQDLLEIAQGQLWNDSDSSDTPISSGWGSYNTAFGPGDLTGEGNSDLLARDTSGVLWLIPGRGNGTFYSRVRLGGGWNAYNQITGTGDINGDGYADIVARAGNGHLYLYLGTGNAKTPFRSRIDVGGGWNAYNKITTLGDLDGDGRADLVATTAGGQLYRYSGSGYTNTAMFKPRVQIGSGGWNAYSSLF